MRRHRPTSPSGGTARCRLAGAGLASLLVSGLVVATAWGDESALGAPRYWPWLLTGLQVLALWSAGAGRRWGWLLGGSVQLPWIAYAVVTTQLGFIPGCAVSAAVQGYSFLLGETGVGGTSDDLRLFGRAARRAQEVST